MKRKKALGTALVFLMILQLAMCCYYNAKQVREEKEPVNLSLWTYYSGAQLERFNELVQEFNDGYGSGHGIVVEASSEGDIETLTEKLRASVEKRAGASALPDIFSCYTDNVYALDDLGLIEDLAPYFTEQEREEYVPGYLDEGDLYNDGSLRVFPVAKATELLMLNRTDWERFSEACDVELSELSTLEGLTRTARIYYEWTDSLTETAGDGRAFFGRDALANYMLVGAKQLGVDLVNMGTDGKLQLNFPRRVARKLWDNYYIPYIRGYFCANGRFRSDDVKSGDALCYVGSSSSASFFPTEVIRSSSEKYPIEALAMEAPRFRDGEAYAVQQGAGMAVLKGSERRIEACVEFLRWFTKEENNIRFSVGSGYLPVKRAANDMEEIRSAMKNGDKISDSVQSSIDTVRHCALYSVKGRVHRIRGILQNNMQTVADRDRRVVLQRQQMGQNLREAAADFESERYFGIWYAGIMAELTEAVQAANEGKE
ncbi:MAG: extracellular solute-binding protein [Oribacterium sp.]